MRILVILGLLVGFLPFEWAHAQTTVNSTTSANATAPAIDPAKKVLILKLMEITGSRARLVEALNLMKKSLPPKAADLINRTANIDELLETLIPIYDRNLSSEDIQGLIDFYQSDLGKKYIEVAPFIMKESMIAGQEYFRNKLAHLRSSENNNQ